MRAQPGVAFSSLDTLPGVRRVLHSSAGIVPREQPDDEIPAAARRWDRRVRFLFCAGCNRRQILAVLDDGSGDPDFRQLEPDVELAKPAPGAQGAA